MKRNIKIKVEYDGNNYGGWQRQTNSTSIQEELEKGLLKLTGEKIHVQGAGRTDSGVHARGQIANFFTDSTIPSERFAFALNSVIPYDIRVVGSEEVDPEFHAQFSAKARRYRYSMITGPYGTAMARDYYYHVPVAELDIESMEKAVAILKGTHDFKGFQATGSDAKTTVRTIYGADFLWEQPYLYFYITGNGFLYNMVRIIVGTLIEIGKGKMEYSKIKDILDTGDRNLAGPTAPAHGLCLEKVYYNYF